jgi:hypothetical protein
MGTPPLICLVCGRLIGFDEQVIYVNPERPSEVAHLSCGDITGRSWMELLCRRCGRIIRGNWVRTDDGGLEHVMCPEGEGK